jgi:hypothetical protein
MDKLEVVYYTWSTQKMLNSFSYRPCGTLTSMTEFVKVMTGIISPKVSRNQSPFLKTGA